MSVNKRSIDYINSICKYREQKLVGAERLTRMAEASGLEEAFDILCESDFGGDKLSFTANDFDSLIQREELLSCEFVKEFAPSKEIENYFLIPYDFYNAEVIVKCLFLNSDPRAFTPISGTVDLEELIAKINNDDLKTLPKELANAIKDGKTALKEGKGGAVVGAIFLKAKNNYFNANLKVKYLREIVKAESLLINVATCLRAKKIEIASEQLLSFGAIESEQIKALCELNEQAVSKAFNGSLFKDIIVKSTLLAKQGKPLVELENFISSFGASRMIANRYTENMGTNPFVLYYLKRKNEIACVRTVLTGKANGLDVEQIKRRIIVC